VSVRQRSEISIETCCVMKSSCKSVSFVCACTFQRCGSSLCSKYTWSNSCSLCYELLSWAATSFRIWSQDAANNGGDDEDEDAEASCAVRAFNSTDLLPSAISHEASTELQRTRTQRRTHTLSHEAHPRRDVPSNSDM